MCPIFQAEVETSKMLRKLKAEGLNFVQSKKCLGSTGKEKVVTMPNNVKKSNRQSRIAKAFPASGMQDGQNEKCDFYTSI